MTEYMSEMDTWLKDWRAKEFLKRADARLELAERSVVHTIWFNDQIESVVHPLFYTLETKIKEMRADIEEAINNLGDIHGPV